MTSHRFRSVKINNRKDMACLTALLSSWLRKLDIPSSGRGRRIVRLTVFVFT
ncbi:hypothetical protein SERLA73DRAFT_134265 [Serpula lacrymans var. lacrymans S7.3]|uniref:Uncharacterized protein n=1 Tax=Serpula lacrymans var. lacrymans (strain S7.3) TaxID=936435 RepID=F8PTS1_SERL3|nr:hypothetical protein SERLA73DRAFT_134265 [Serpula lacrymans var. lacrymans S7.3]